jgi:homogentisate 1,2-dioxygenase
MAMLRGGAWIAKKIQHASFVKVALKRETTLATECNSKGMSEGAVIVETQMLGTVSTFALTTKDMSDRLIKSWRSCQNQYSIQRTLFLRKFASN